MPRSADFRILTECAKCAEPMPVDVAVCDFCGYAARPRKAISQRLAEVASLAAALAFVVAVCRVLGHLLGV